MNLNILIPAENKSKLNKTILIKNNFHNKKINLIFLAHAKHLFQKNIMFLNNNIKFHNNISS